VLALYYITVQVVNAAEAFI